MPNDLLDLSEFEACSIKYHFQKRYLSEPVNQVLSEIGSLAEEKKIKIEFIRTGVSDQVVIDRDRIIQVIRNLLSNAVRYSDVGKTIKVTLKSQNSSIILSIIDNGVGIPENEMDLIFDKFSQGSRTQAILGGTGIGLTICKKIIEDHQGHIWAEKNPEGGSIFSFKLKETL